MSILFNIRDHQWPIDQDGLRLPPASMFVQLSNVNAREFLDWLGLHDAELWGEMPAHQLAPLLRRRLWPANRQRGNAARPGYIERASHGLTVICCGRSAERLAECAERLLALAEHARDGIIVWS